jgi:glutamate formiminotransferase
VLDYVRRLAAEQGAQVVETELIGVAPASAIAEVAAHCLQNASLNEEHILDLWMDPEWNP